MRKLRFLSVLLLLWVGVMSLSAQTATEEPDPQDAPPELVVVSVLPEDGTNEVAGRAVITVIFNRPVVPLVIVEDMDNLPQPLTISPAIAGVGEWLNTSIYTFTPDVIWSPNTEYTIMVNAGLTAVDGTVLAKDFVWSFVTTEPEVIEVIPSNGENGIGLNRTFQMVFNMPMDTASVEAAFFLRPQSENSGTTAGEFEWDEDNTGFRFTPTDLLIIDSNYEAGFDSGVVFAASGDKPMARGFTSGFQTVPYPEIIGSDPRDESSPSSVWEVSIRFNTFMEVESFDGLITIDPAPASDPNLYFQSWNDALSISFYIEPSTYYTITLAPGGKDPYGNEVGGYEFSFTSPPYRPQLQIRSTGAVGFYNANNPQTQLFITHLNVSYVDLSLYKVPLAEFALRALDEDSYDIANDYSLRNSDLLKNWQIESVAPPNLTRFELLNLGEGLYEDKEALDPGIYLLNVESPETRREGYDPYKHFMVVGTANLTTKMSIDSVVVWATDIQTGLPIPNAPIAIYDGNYSEVARGITDADGMLRLELPRTNDVYDKRIAVLDDGTYFGVGLSTWSNGIESYNFGVPSNYYPQEYSVYLYTDRPIYRPGQPVYFRGVIRNKDDVTYTPYGEPGVPVQIYDDSGEIVYEKTVMLTEFGTFSDTFDIAPEAGLGSYRLSVELPSRQQWYSEGSSLYFAVAEYRLPEFLVENVAVEPEVVQGGVVQVDVSSRYFFGGLVSNARVNYTVVSEPYNFPYKGKGYYDFYDYDPDGGPSEYYSYSGGWVGDGEGMTDGEGKYRVEVAADLKDSTLSQVFRVETTITDESQQSVSNRTEVVVHKGELYVGVRPQRYVGTSEVETAFEFVTVDWDSNPVPNQELAVEIVERRWSSVQEEDSNGRTIWTWEQETIPVTTGTVTTDADGKAVFNFTPPNGGIFKAIATTTDSLGNEIRSATTMWVSSRQYVSWRQQNSNRIDLIASQRDFSVGDEAEILITSPFQGSVEALITVERGDILTVERVTMDSNSYLYKFPILPEYAPNVYVTVLLVKGVDENNPVAGFRMGVIALNVDIAQKELTIEITPNVEQAAPGETVTYTVQTTNYLGEGVQAEVGVGLTDLAALSISSPNSRPLLEHFYSSQGMGVLTAMALTMNTDQITREVLDTIKGGGGGPGDGGIFDIRQEFVDTAYWNATLVTDENGMATFDVVMPDNLTTWRLDARAVTSGEDGLTLVGQNTFDLISTRPLLIRPVTTRFFVVGDIATLSAVVNNNTDADQTVFVEVLAEGVTLQDDARKTVEIPAGGRARITWQALIEDVSWVDLTFFAMNEDGSFTDASKPPLGQGDERLLPVYRYEVPEIVGTGGFLRGQETITEAIVLPEDWAIYEGQLTLQTDHSLASSAIESLDYLELYTEYGAEAVVSSFLPNIMVYRAMESLGLNDMRLRANLDRRADAAIQALYAQQHVDGGWGWYYSDYSSPTVTAWALIGLKTAKDFGFPVSDSVMSRAQAYLTENLITPSLRVSTWQLNRQAFLLYALAYSGSPNVASMSTLYDSRERMSIYSKTLLARALHLGGGNEERISTLISDVMNVAILSANGAHWEETGRDYRNWNTDTRTTAMVLGMLVQLRPDNELIPNVVRYLMVMRQADAWSTTQETAWSLMALTDWMVVSEELKGDYDYTVTFNGEELTSQSITAENVTTSQTMYVHVADMLRGEANNIVIDRTAGTGNLYYTAYLRVNLPVSEVEPLDRGIIINRRYTLADDEENTPITEAQIGELVRVRLTIIIPNSLHYVVIEDPFPAGAEAVNPRLLTSQQTGTRPSLNLGNPLSRGWGWWYFSSIDFYDEKAVLSATYLPAGTYEFVYTIRPGLEGVYNVIPPIGYEFFFPDVYGRGAGSIFTVLPTE
jgi:uncharacterized protein YfaS (alpha-2-macroglobulin family)